jgi:hypothetical protein
VSTETESMPSVGQTRTLGYLLKKPHICWGPKTYDTMIAQGWLEPFEVKGQSYLRITDKGRVACLRGQEYHKGWIP